MLYRLPELFSQCAALKSFDRELEDTVSSEELQLVNEIVSQLSPTSFDRILNWIQPDNPGGVLSVAMLVVWHAVISQKSIYLQGTRAESIRVALLRGLECSYPAVREKAVTSMALLAEWGWLDAPKEVHQTVENHLKNSRESLQMISLYHSLLDKISIGFKTVTA